MQSTSSGSTIISRGGINGVPPGSPNEQPPELLTAKEQREGRTERILPGNLVRLRVIDQNVNIAIATLLTENDQLHHRIAFLQKNLTPDAIGENVEERLKRVLESFTTGA